MTNLFDYLDWRGDLTFQQASFNLVDNLILSCLGYVVLDAIVSGFDCDSVITVKETADLFVQLPERVKNLRVPEDETLLVSMGKSKRFGALQLLYHVQQLDRETEKQFAAITINLGDGSYYVAYRGTDLSITGWKEDFNMTFRSGVPAQQEAVRYLQRVAEITTGPLYVGGHSKGGNLAVYASMNCSAGVRERIDRIYDHDGPGFRPEVRQKSAYEEIAGRIYKTVPRSSCVGMLLYTEENYKVVESKTIGLAQHNPYTWLIRDDNFKIVEEIRAGRKFMDQALNEWILSLDQEQMHTFVDTLYRVVQASETDNLIDFTANWLKSIHKIGTALKEVDRDTADVIVQIMRALFEVLSAHAKEQVKSKRELQKNKFEEGVSQLEQYFRKER